MNTKCNRLIVALYELKSQKMSFICFFLISAVLLSAIISCFTLTVQLPDEISDYILNTGYGSLTVSDLRRKDLDLLEQMPVKLFFYAYQTFSPTSIGLPLDVQFTYIDESDGEKYEANAMTSGCVVRWADIDGHNTAEDINQKLTVGAPLSESINSEEGIWLSDNAANYLGVGLNDTISFMASPNETAKVNCTVKGIYTQDSSLYAFYVSHPLFELSDYKYQFLTTAFVAPRSIKDFYNLANQMKAEGWSLSYDKEFIDGVMMLVTVLYTFCVLLCFIEMSIIYSIAKSYYIKRKQFFAMAKALGMSNRDIFFVVCFVLHALITLAFAVALLISPMLNSYIIDFLNSLFSDVSVSSNIFNVYTLSVYVVVSVLLWLTCIISQRFYKSADISDFLKQNDN